MSTYGERAAGVTLQRMQLICVLGAASAVWFCGTSYGNSAGTTANAHVASLGYHFVFMAFITLSRVGLWGFDVCERQVLQQATRHAGSAIALFTVERGIAEVANIAMLAASFAFQRPEEYYYLAALSAASVATATALLVGVVHKTHQR